MVIENGRAVLEEHSGAGLEAARLRAALASAQQEKAEALALLGKMREALDPWVIWCFLRGKGSKVEKFRPEFWADDLGEDLRAYSEAALATPAPAALEEMRERVAMEHAQAFSAGWEAGRIEALEAAAKVCDERSWEISPKTAEDVEEFPAWVGHRMQALDGAAAAIRAMKREGEG